MSSHSVSNDGCDRQTSITVQSGERINFTITDAVVESVVDGADHPDAMTLLITTGDGPGDMSRVHIRTSSPAVTITRVVPAWWPPQSGQVLLVDGKPRWVTGATGRLWLMDEHGNQQLGQHVLEDARRVGAPVELVTIGTRQPDDECDGADR